MGIVATSLGSLINRAFPDFFFCSAAILLLIATTLYHIVSVANQCRFVLNYLSLVIMKMSVILLRLIYSDLILLKLVET